MCTIWTITLKHYYFYLYIFSEYIFSNKYFFSDSPWDTGWAAIGTRGDLGQGAAEGVRRGSRSGWHRRCSSGKGSWDGASTWTRGPRWGPTLGSGTRHGRSVEKIKKDYYFGLRKIILSIHPFIHPSSCTSFFLSFFLSFFFVYPSAHLPACMSVNNANNAQ